MGSTEAWVGSKPEQCFLPLHGLFEAKWEKSLGDLVTGCSTKRTSDTYVLNSGSLDDSIIEFFDDRSGCVGVESSQVIFERMHSQTTRDDKIAFFSEQRDGVRTNR